MEHTKKLIEEAILGNKESLETIVQEIQGLVYSLCVRMLWDKEESLDATQEILVKIITHLSEFQFKSSFKTWVYRIASNHLLDIKRKSKYQDLSFEAFESDLLSDLSSSPEMNQQSSPEYQVLLNELRLSCTTALLLCLDRPHRISYILGEILQLDHSESASILDINKESHRKRLQRSREKINSFVKDNCGFLSGPKAKCQCSRKTTSFSGCRRNNNENAFLNEKTNLVEVKKYISQIEQTKKASWHYRSQGVFSSPKDFSNLVKQLF